jgi:hypothetical protein
VVRAPARLKTFFLGLFCLGVASFGTGCNSNEQMQIETLQVVANALRARDLEAACALNVDALRSPVTCQGMITLLQHYSPGFRGARVVRRGNSSGWRYSKRVTVPVHYDGPDGSGNLDVTMERSPAGWRIAAIFPKR